MHRKELLLLLFILCVSVTLGCNKKYTNKPTGEALNKNILSKAQKISFVSKQCYVNTLTLNEKDKQIFIKLLSSPTSVMQKKRVEEDYFPIIALVTTKDNPPIQYDFHCNKNGEVLVYYNYIFKIDLTKMSLEEMKQLINVNKQIFNVNKSQWKKLIDKYIE